LYAARVSGFQLSADTKNRLKAFLLVNIDLDDWISENCRYCYRWNCQLRSLSEAQRKDDAPLGSLEFE
jgi:hypothetical protein